MTQEALLQQIISDPQNDASRLEYAAWLEQNNQPKRADLIRVQCELALLEKELSDDELRWRRAWALSSYRKTKKASEDRFDALVSQEEQLLSESAAHWFGYSAEEDEHLSFRYHRGFLDEVSLSASSLLSSPQETFDEHPLLRNLVVYGPRGKGADLASCALLRRVQSLELCGWMAPQDALELASSGALRTLSSLTLWIGHEDDHAVCLSLASALPASCELVLVQLYGGLFAGDDAESLNERAETIAQEARGLIRNVRIERPYTRRFPLGGSLDYEMYAGHLENQQPALVMLGPETQILLFDKDGDLVDEETLEMDDNLKEEEMLALFRQERGFEVAPIFVREFESSEIRLRLWGSYEDIVENPDKLDESEQEDACDSLDSFWIKEGNFELFAHNDYWVGPDGFIHSS